MNKFVFLGANYRKVNLQYKDYVNVSCVRYAELQVLENLKLSYSRSGKTKLEKLLEKVL